MGWRTPADDNGLQRPFTDSTRQLSTASGVCARAISAAQWKVQAYETAAESAGKRPGQHHLHRSGAESLTGHPFGLSPPATCPPCLCTGHTRAIGIKRLLRAAESAAFNSCQLWHIRHEETRKEVSP